MGATIRRCCSAVVRFALLPAAFYLALFVVLTYPLVTQFSTHFFADGADGLQNVWNIWWVGKAITGLRQSPWHTSYLHHPWGVSLLAHTLNPFNGLLGVVLLRFLTLVQAHNFIVVFSFVVGGLTACWLCYDVTRSYWGSLVGGFVFTFSSYHFAHAQGHLQLVSLEWIPLFVLCWYRLLMRPSVTMAVCSAFALCAVLLCDYYYFAYSLVVAVLMVLWQGARSKRYLFFARKPHVAPLAVFAAGTLATAGPLIGGLLALNARETLLGAGDPAAFSLDLLAPIIPGGHWRFSHLTAGYWSRLTCNIHESSVHLGVSVLFLIAYSCVKRRRLGLESLSLWLAVWVTFMVMSLGPVLHVWGQPVPGLPLPYALAQKIVPALEMSGRPIRMMVIVFLSASVISAAGMGHLLRGRVGAHCLAALLAVMLLVEYVPRPMPATSAAVPGFVEVLAARPAVDGALIDGVTQDAPAMYHQTVHGKPKAFGYIARPLKRVLDQDRGIREALIDQQYEALRDRYHFRYLVVDVEAPVRTECPSAALLWTDGELCLYDLAPGAPVAGP